MSDSKLTLNSPVVNYGAAALAGAAVGSITPTAIKFAKEGVKSMPKVDTFLRNQKANAVAIKDGIKSRVKNAFNALFKMPELKEGTKPSAFREFLGSTKKLIKESYAWCAKKAEVVTKHPTAKWATIGAAVGLAAYYTYNKFVNKNN